MAGDPKLLLTRIKRLFKMTCFILAIYMIVMLIGRFLENRDATLITYKKYSQTPIDDYPTYSICFKGATFHWYHDSEIFRSFGVYPSEYEQMLTGQTVLKYEYNLTSRLYWKTPIFMGNESKVNFEDFHVKISDILTNLKFVTEDPIYDTHYENPSDRRPLEKPPFYVGYHTAQMICFTRKLNDRLYSIKVYDQLSFNRSIMQNGMYDDTEMSIFVHHPTQLMRSIDHPSFEASFHEYQKNKLLELKVSQGTFLKKRPDSNDPCNEKIDDHDTYLQRETSKKFNCVPPYWNERLLEALELERCIIPSTLGHLHNHINNYTNLVRNSDRPCLDMFNSVNYNWITKELDDQYNDETSSTESKSRLTSDKISTIKVSYTDKSYQEILFVRDFGIESVWSGIGGFVGIFLRYSMMQFPEMLGNVAAMTIT